MANNALPDPVNVNLVSPDPVNTDPVSKDFYYEVARGAVPGVTILRVDSVNQDVGTAASEDVWGVGGQLVYPTSAEQWEVVSTDVNDAAAGTGAQTVLVTYLDDNYLEQSESVTLNGTTPVLLVATDSFRPTRITSGVTRVTAVGSGGNNSGDITTQVAGGGAARGVIPAGANRSLDCHYTVPDGKVARVIGFSVSVQKNKDSVFTLEQTTGADGIFLSSLPIGAYQATVIDSSVAPFFNLAAMTDVKISVTTENNATQSAANILFALEDL